MGGWGFLDGLGVDAEGDHLAIGGVVAGVADPGVGLVPAGFGEGEVVALILERILLPGVDDDVKGLVEELGVELGVASVSSGAELGGGPGIEATGDAEVDASVGEVIQQGNVLGDA